MIVLYNDSDADTLWVGQAVAQLCTLATYTANVCICIASLIRSERYRHPYWGTGYWPILASIGWYWYWPNTFLSNRAQYWAENSLRRRLATHNEAVGSMRVLLLA